ncbi:MAG: hypothetical protein LBL43_00180 [Treponema sp.]|nr:hypothetical protein [Treponema sp.]
MPGWKDYFEAVTLGSFGKFFPKTGESAERFVSLVRGIKTSRLVLHFFLVSLALNFPVMFAVSRLKPYALFSRIYGDGLALRGSGNIGSIEDFNILMYQNAYGRKILLPVLGMAFALVLILQAVFYVLAALGLGLQRLSLSYLSFRERLGLLLLSSTGAAFLAALFGLLLPTVHIVVFYLAVIAISFRRSKLCPNG